MQLIYIKTAILKFIREKLNFKSSSGKKKTITNHFLLVHPRSPRLLLSPLKTGSIVVHCTVSFPRLVTELSDLAFANAHNGRLSRRQITFPHPHDFPPVTHTQNFHHPLQSISELELIFRHQVRRSCRFDWSTLNEHLTIIEPSL